MKYLLLFAMFSCSANALDYKLDIGAGMTRTEFPVNGRWYQEEFEHSIDTDSESWHVGANFKTPHEPLSVSVGYMNLGKFGTDALASASDANYAAYKAGTENIWPMSTWKGRGEVDGWYGVLEYDFKHFYIRYGAWLHKATWSVDIPDWRSRKNGPARHLYVAAEDSSKWGQVYGIGRRFGQFSLSYEIWEIQESNDLPSSYFGDAQNISLNYRF